MTPSQQHDAPMATPNSPLAPQWNVSEAIPDMGDLLGVDLRHEFSVEADEEEAGRHDGQAHNGEVDGVGGEDEDHVALSDPHVHGERGCHALHGTP